MSGKARERLSPAQRRAVIIDAGTRVLAEHGYDRTSMRDLASAANVTTPVLYDHFRSKAALYRAVVEHHAGRLIDDWSQTPEAESTEDFFVGAATAFFTWIRDNEPSWRILFADQPRAPEAIAINLEVRALADQAMAESVARLPGLDLPAAMDRELAIAAIAAQVTGAGNALAAWWWQHRELPVEAVVELNRRLVWTGLGRLTD